MININTTSSAIEELVESLRWLIRLITFPVSWVLICVTGALAFVGLDNLRMTINHVTLSHNIR